MTECLERADVTGCGECEICRRRRAPNLETEHGYLIAVRRATNAVSRVEASHEFVSASAAQSLLHCSGRAAAC